MPIGAAMMFVLSLVACAIAALFVVTYASRIFMNVLNGTAAGNDDIPWGTDPFIDQLLEPFFLVFLLALGSVAVLVPVGLLFPDLLDHPAGAPLVVAGVAWLIFPILLLSALTGTSRWYVLHWELLRRLVRRPLALAVFYVSAGVNLFIGCGAAWIAVSHTNPFAVVAIALTAACVLIHARLCGRLAWIVSQTPIGQKKRSKRPRLRGVTSTDPWQVPEESERADYPPPALQPETAFKALQPHAIQEQTSAALAPADAEEDEWTPNKKPYAFSTDAPAQAPPRVQPNNLSREAITASPRGVGGDDEAGEELNMLPASAEPPAETSTPYKQELPQPDRIEIRWQEGRRLPPLPRWPLIRGVWSFPFFQTTLDKLLALSVLSLVLAFLIRMLISLSQGEIHGAL
jgi:hypothetical protein